jgi:hypothetical protein
MSIGNIHLLRSRYQGRIRRSLIDMSNVLSECKWVLKPNGSLVFVVGDSEVRGVYVRNSDGIIRLAERSGFKLVSRKKRQIKTRRRYMPPPDSSKSGDRMSKRMREESVIVFAIEG